MAIKCPYCEYECDYPFSVHSVHCDECGKKFYLGSEDLDPIKEEDKGDFLVECLVIVAIVIMLFSCKINGFSG